MPEFRSRDPNSPAFWDERFEQEFTPWDRGGVPAAFAGFVARSRPLRTLIPGCGTGYELALLRESGWDATAIDFSGAAVVSARQALGKWGEHVEQADFFDWTPAAPLELIYERAFLCAMPRAMWPKVVARWAALLPPGAILAGYFFFDEAPKGPPFGISEATLSSLMAPHFEQLEDAPVSDSIPVFAGKERWRLYRRL